LRTDIFHVDLDLISKRCALTKKREKKGKKKKKRHEFGKKKKKEGEERRGKEEAPVPPFCSMLPSGSNSRVSGSCYHRFRATTALWPVPKTKEKRERRKKEKKDVSAKKKRKRKREKKKREEKERDGSPWDPSVLAETDSSRVYKFSLNVVFDRSGEGEREREKEGGSRI